MKFLSGLLAAFALGASAETKITRDTQTKLLSTVLPGSLLPQFLFMQGNLEGGAIGFNTGGGRGIKQPFIPDDSAGEDIFDGALEDQRSPQLPYLTQDLWGCEREEGNMDTVVMEDEFLKVTIVPSVSGKVWSIYDKKRNRDVLYNNPAHQPANIGALKAWGAGGSEWNWSPGIIGHSAFSESTLHTARVSTDKGEVVRVFEYDRYNSTVFQVDMMLDGKGAFFFHPKITNNNDADLRGYWWTCVAVDSTPSTRILTPASHVAETTASNMRDAPWPHFTILNQNSSFSGYAPSGADYSQDMSYIGNHLTGDMFLRIMDDDVYTPYIAHTDIEKDGFFLVHGHKLNGTKFFTWGQNGPGRFMQDFLAGGLRRQGDYTELQVGPTPTQMQSFPVPAQSKKEWTDWFKGFDGDQTELSSLEYSDAISEVDSHIQNKDSGVTNDYQKEMDDFLKSIADLPVTEMLVQGSPWGALEEKLRGESFSQGLPFALPKEGEEQYDEMKPWLELLEDGVFSAETLAMYTPVSFQTTDAWMNLLEVSADKFGMNYLTALHLGIGYMERGEIDRPVDLFQTSLKLNQTVVAYRNLALLQQTPSEVNDYFQKAWSHFKATENTGSDKDAVLQARLGRNLATEILSYYQQENMVDEMSDLLSDLSDLQSCIDFESLDLVQTSRVLVNLALATTSSYNSAIKILASNYFPTYASARTDLSSFWFRAHEGLAEINKGSPLTNIEALRARKADPVPENIGCQYGGQYCDSYW
ncbi:hypothetical protein TrST_g11002 [Triparma strigata]|uniref:Uncharacterized protein n=1 Tax=Triparma strigata TaxID=1606541 RepID=A0A9W6ZGB4_9STRA|nr:hypothetical protein TrST_g11002 [Triparma strigata]